MPYCPILYTLCTMPVPTPSEATLALVRAMVHVERVLLGGEVSLDIRALTQYSGQGRCREVRWTCDTADRYRAEHSTELNYSR